MITFSKPLGDLSDGRRTAEIFSPEIGYERIRIKVCPDDPETFDEEDLNRVVAKITEFLDTP